MQIARRFDCFLENVRGVNLCLRHLIKGNAMTIQVNLSDREIRLMRRALLLTAEQAQVDWYAKHRKVYDLEIDALRLNDFYALSDWLKISEMCEETKNELTKVKA